MLERLKLAPHEIKKAVLQAETEMLTPDKLELMVRWIPSTEEVS